ncbi:MAG: thiamine pyrophosphate-dependent dehydrogenase E1 component subunit alpha [Burkholderiales bacterium]
MRIELSPEELLPLYATMVLIRRSEERLSRLFGDGEIPGFLHLSIGQEAVPVGVCAALQAGDSVASTHRGHGHALAKGVDLRGFFAEILGREEGLCRGRGGSIHVADLRVGMLGANGIVGGGLPLALGSALAHQVRRTGGVAVAFFGDGAMSEGVLHECLNLAALWKLPLIFACENNGWSEFSPLILQFAAQLGALAGAFGIPALQVDGSDVESVRTAASGVIAAARCGDGPQILECKTFRWRGHYEGDPQKYRDAGDLADARGRDPLIVSRARLEAAGIAAERIRKLESDVEANVEAAVEAARRGREPDYAAAAADVYTAAAGGARG